MFIPSLVITEDKMLLDIKDCDYLKFCHDRNIAVNAAGVKYRGRKLDLLRMRDGKLRYIVSVKAFVEPTKQTFDNYLFDWWSKQSPCEERTKYFQDLLLEAKHKDKKFPDDIVLEFSKSEDSKMFVPSLVEISRHKAHAPTLDLIIWDSVEFHRFQRFLYPYEGRKVLVKHKANLYRVLESMHKPDRRVKVCFAAKITIQQAFNDYLMNWWERQHHSAARVEFFNSKGLPVPEVLVDPPVEPEKKDYLKEAEELKKFYDSGLGEPWDEDVLPEVEMPDDRCTMGSLQVGDCCNYYLRTIDFTGEIACIVIDVNTRTGLQLQTSRGVNFQANTRWQCRRISVEKFLEEEAAWDKHLYEQETFDDRSRRDGNFIATQLKDITDIIYSSTPEISGPTGDEVWITEMDDTPRHLHGHLHGVSPFKSGRAYVDKVEADLFKASSESEDLSIPASPVKPEKYDLDGLVLTYLENARRFKAPGSPTKRLCDEVDFWRRKYLGDNDTSEVDIEQILREMQGK